MTGDVVDKAKMGSWKEMKRTKIVKEGLKASFFGSGMFKTTKPQNQKHQAETNAMKVDVFVVIQKTNQDTDQEQAKHLWTRFLNNRQEENKRQG